MALGRLATKPEFTKWRLPPPPEVTLDGVRGVLLGLKHLDQVHGFGVFGSLGGQQARRFDPTRSDIDVFIVLKENHAGEHNRMRWIHRIMDALGDHFRRRVDVLVFTLPLLKSVPGWHAISMASDCPVLYDPEGKVADVLRRIVAAARTAGLAQHWVGPHRLWHKPGLKMREVIHVRVPDDDLDERE